MWNVVYEGNSGETQYPGFFIQGCYMGIFWLALVKIPDFQEENRCSPQTILYLQLFKHTVALLFS